MHVSDGTPPWPSARVAWYAVGVLVLAFTFSLVDRTILSLLVQPIRAAFHISDTQVSLLHGLAFAIFYTTMGVPIARLSDRHARRRIIALGIALWSVMTGLCAFADTFWELFLARVGVGVGEAVLLPAAYSMIADLFPEARLGRALGVFSTGLYLGTGVALMLGGAAVAGADTLAALGGDWGASVRPWQWVFLIVGLPGLAVAALMGTVPEPARRGHARAANHDERAAAGELAAFLRAHARTLGCHFAGFSLLACVLNAAVAWMPTFLMRDYALTAGTAGLRLGLVTVAFGTVGIVAGGLAADAMRARGAVDGTLIVGVIAAAGIALFGAATPLAPGLAATLACYCGFMFFASVPFGAAAAALQIVTPNALRAQISALFLFVLNLCGIGFGPTLTALITDHVFRADRAVGLSLALIAAVGGPVAAAVLHAGRGPFRESVSRARLAAATPGTAAPSSSSPSSSSPSIEGVCS